MRPFRRLPRPVRVLLFAPATLLFFGAAVAYMVGGAILDWLGERED